MQRLIAVAELFRLRLRYFRTFKNAVKGEIELFNQLNLTSSS